jgi:arsenite methyltransferase
VATGKARPDYGIDAPPVIRNLMLIGLALVGVGFAAHAVQLGSVRLNLRSMFFFAGSGQIASALLMLLYAKAGKFSHRDRVLAMIPWRGDERVLDVGTGRGLLLIGAARRAPRGRAVGIDIWNAADLSGNVAAATLENARLEGVLDRVELQTGDARKMDFPDGSFDAVVSNLCLHNIADAAGREQACAEIARVVKPGGVVLVSDFKHTADYARAFRTHGLEVKETGPYLTDTFPPLRVVRAQKASIAP